MADARRANFDLDKRVGLKDIDIQVEQLTAERSRGLRDIGQQRELGVESVVNNALQRGIFRSGITERNTGRVNREANEAQFDLKGDISRALARLANQREGIAGKQFIGDGGGGGLGGFFSDLLELINSLADNRVFNPIDFMPPPGSIAPPVIPGRPS